jgi:hypothetical protein
LDELDGLLGELRGIPGLKEKSRGTFSRRSRAFLHFHEDAAGLFADVRFDEEFERIRVTTPEERAALVRQIRARL